MNINNNWINKYITIIINNSDNLSNYAQSSLRYIIERYVNNCKFIFICENSDKIIDAIKSRCVIIDMINPKIDEIKEFVNKYG